MVRHFLFSITVGLVLSGCSSSPSRTAAVSSLHENHVEHVRTEKYLPDFSHSEPNAEKEKMLASLRPSSPEWAALYGEIEAEENRRLTSKTMICRTCFPDKPDYTGAIPQK
jgi:hypothetical protein